MSQTSNDKRSNPNITDENDHSYGSQADSQADSQDKTHHDQLVEVCFDLEAGTEEFYQDTAYYDYEFRSRTEDVDFYKDRYLDCEGWALEIGVGTGRIALPAVKAGARVIGLDVHEGMLKAAQNDVVVLDGGVVSEHL